MDHSKEDFPKEGFLEKTLENRNGLEKGSERLEGLEKSKGSEKVLEESEKASERSQGSEKVEGSEKASEGLKKVKEPEPGLEPEVEDKTDIINIFQSVWKIGPIEANKFYEQGCRSLEDLKSGRIILNENQKIGLKYYEELKHRVPREVITEYLKNLKELIPEYEIEAVGSYRRENLLCGDIDLLIYNKDDTVDLLAIKDRMVSNNMLIEVMCVGQKKLMGLARIDLTLDKSLVCHVDINVTPKKMLAFALLTHTGNSVFNIKIRQLAQKQNMKLSQYGLGPNSLDLCSNEDKENKKKPNDLSDEDKEKQKEKEDEVKSEEDIFKLLNTPYIPPNKRNEQSYPSLSMISSILENHVTTPFSSANFYLQRMWR